MAYDTAYLINPRTGQIRSAPIGFSWTSFFFGPMPMLFRGAWKWFFIQWPNALCTLGLSGLIWMFIVNRLYLGDLLRDGFRFKGAARGGTVDSVATYARFPLHAIAGESE